MRIWRRFLQLSMFKRRVQNTISIPNLSEYGFDGFEDCPDRHGSEFGSKIGSRLGAS